MVDTSHGMPDDPISQRHVGDLGNLEANVYGGAYAGLVDRTISLRLSGGSRELSRGVHYAAAKFFKGVWRTKIIIYARRK
jgi:hypothetical protein